MTDTQPSGWPDPARPGYPLHPERDGWHWVAGMPRAWLSKWQQWDAAAAYLTPEEMARRASVLGPYLGPCLTPADLAAERAAAAEQMREACAEACDGHAETLALNAIGGLAVVAARTSAAIIRSLPIPSASALLARAEAAEAAMRGAVTAAANADAERDAARAEAAMATKRERARIVAALIDQADVTPCSEDRRVVFDCARLVLVDFSYDAADHLGDEDAIRRAAATASARAALAGEGREDGA